MNKVLIFSFIVAICAVLFSPFVFYGKLPLPADTIVGLYHPFRDLYATEYPNGIPFKNSLITDPVRQQFLWRELAVTELKKLSLPLWNPYSFSGTPLLANSQSAPLYPLNLLYVVMPFTLAWSILVFLQPLLAGIFMYLYLRALRLHQIASLFGATVFSLCGFSIVWLEWNTILHTAFWLPLILLSVDKIFRFSTEEISNNKYKIANIHVKNMKLIIWSTVLLLSSISSFFAGHLQTFFYLLLIVIGYTLVRWMQYGRGIKVLLLFLFCFSFFALITAVVWIPTLQFIAYSARNVDQSYLSQEGWFLPWQHLIQFIAPDFFGNPTTLNYWGVWNYAEFSGYVSIAPLIFAFFALFFRRDRKTLFFGTFFFLSLLFALPTFLGKLPYLLHIPFISTAQPTRLLFITDFSLAILAALGFDYFMKTKQKTIIYVLLFVGVVILGLWAYVLFGSNLASSLNENNLFVAKRNLYLPSGVYAASVFLLGFLFIFLRRFSPSKRESTTIMIYIIIVVITALDFIRFGVKFTPFTDRSYLFPQTKTISFLQNNLGNARFMSVDPRILPPNFPIMYRLQSIEGYDPLYLQRYAELIAASERKQPNVSPPFGYNRIITPQNFDSKIIDLLGVKYVLSLSDIDHPKLKKVFQEGKTIVYENTQVFPRAFFVDNIKTVFGKEEAIVEIFQNDLRKTAIIEELNFDYSNLPADEAGNQTSVVSENRVEIREYSENKIVLQAETKDRKFLVFTDIFYPTWRVRINDVSTKLYRVNYVFRGVLIPPGRHTIVFYNSLL